MMLLIIVLYDLLLDFDFMISILLVCFPFHDEYISNPVFEEFYRKTR